MEKTLKLGVGDTIVIRTWRKFGEKKMRCTGIDTSEYGYGDNRRFVFDDGVEWSEEVLAKNFELWNRRNGYEIRRA